MKTSLVIPSYNEGKRIVKVIREIRRLDKNIRIVVVDDGSTDSTERVLKRLEERNVKVIKHKTNLGKGAAMKTGAIYAFDGGEDAVIFMDADNQHSPRDLDKFKDKLRSGKYDVVLGVRREAKDVPVIRGFGNKIGIVIIYLLFGIKVSDLLCGYRAITKNAFKKLSLKSSGYGIETEMVAKIGLLKLKYSQVMVETIYHDKTKGVTILHAFGILIDVLRWRLLP